MPEYTPQQIERKCIELGYTGTGDQIYTQWAANMNHVPPAPALGFPLQADFYAWCAEHFTGTL